MNQETEFLKAYDEHADALFRYCYFKLSDREAAKDAVQEIYLKIWRYMQDGKKIDHMKSFMYVTAGNHIKDVWKKKKAIPMSALDTEEGQFDTPDERMDIHADAEVSNALRHLKSLSESDQEVLRLRFAEGMTPGEIGEIIGVSENAVSVRVNRALSRLRNKVDPSFLYQHDSQ